MSDAESYEAVPWPGQSASLFSSVRPSRQPSVAPPSSGEVSALAAHLADHLGEIAEDADALAFEHVESFNLLCVGESGLGKSTFLRNIFAHLDPTKLHEVRRRVAAQADVVQSLEDVIARNEHESGHAQCDDVRALALREERTLLKAKRGEALQTLEDLKLAKRTQEHAVGALRSEIGELASRIKELRGRRDAEEDDDVAAELGRQVIELQGERKAKEALLTSELRRSNLDKESDGGGGGGQTTDVVERLIKEMPLYDGARQGLDVTLIDTPGYGDLLVDTPGRSSADKVVAEVERRISVHLAQEVASRDDMPLDEEKKLWNGLVHLCLFFIPPHRMKRADVELMQRLHTLVPLVVVIAKSDTMTTEETWKFKHQVCDQLKQHVSTFRFNERSIKEVEQLHAEHAVDTFQPLYGGADGSLPWAVMGADDSQREYIWGTAITNEPRHSELPALRDLLLRAGGWQQLKRDAALKADKEAARRAKATLPPRRWGSELWRGTRVGAEGLLSSRLLSPLLAVLALVAALVVALTVRDAFHKEMSSVLTLEQQLEALGRDLSSCSQARDALDRASSAAKAERMLCERKVAMLEDDWNECTQVRKALEIDLQAIKTTPKPPLAAATERQARSWW